MPRPSPIASGRRRHIDQGLLFGSQQPGIHEGQVSTCALCLDHRPLRDSHIVPKFIFEHLKRTSATGFLRAGTEPNLRAQDGVKVPLLCEQCEQRFSVFERSFAQGLFRPYSADRSRIISYGPWLAKFAASLTWRILQYYKREGHLNELQPQHLPAVEVALRVWREYLLGLRPHPDRFEQHMLPIDVLQSASIPGLPPNFNRYSVRAVDMDVASGKHFAFVYAKLPRFVFIGWITPPAKRRPWKGTRLQTKAGQVRPREYAISDDFFEYMVGKASRANALSHNISPRQQEIINRATLANLERTSASETVEAMSYDVEMFGLAAFHTPDEPEA